MKWIASLALVPFSLVEVPLVEGFSATAPTSAILPDADLDTRSSLASIEEQRKSFRALIENLATLEQDGFGGLKKEITNLKRQYAKQKAKRAAAKKAAGKKAAGKKAAAKSTVLRDMLRKIKVLETRRKELREDITGKSFGVAWRTSHDGEIENWFQDAVQICQVAEQAATENSFNPFLFDFGDPWRSVGTRRTLRPLVIPYFGCTSSDVGGCSLDALSRSSVQQAMRGVVAFAEKMARAVMESTEKFFATESMASIRYLKKIKWDSLGLSKCAWKREEDRDAECISELERSDNMFRDLGVDIEGPAMFMHLFSREKKKKKYSKEVDGADPFLQWMDDSREVGTVAKMPATLSTSFFPGHIWARGAGIKRFVLEPFVLGIFVPAGKKMKIVQVDHVEGQGVDHVTGQMMVVQEDEKEYKTPRNVHLRRLATVTASDEYVTGLTEAVLPGMHKDLMKQGNYQVFQLNAAGKLVPSIQEVFNWGAIYEYVDTVEEGGGEDSAKRRRKN